ncbi:hypothetical protein SLS62_005935 [Diatrype stigma]|uniref:F-box domain-containing protein n=1 Tax=Diatrype stigma TaxID=117547 RepID=A0AAN9US08_9PEZI
MAMMETSAAGLQLEQLQRLPELPVELWAHIIGFITDSRYLPRTWLHFRHVSRAFKFATEMAFVGKHLPHADLVFKEPPSSGGGGGSVQDINANLIVPKVVFKFDHLADGGSRAVFTRRHPVEALREVRIAGCTTTTTTTTNTSGDTQINNSDNNLFDLSIRRWREALEPYATAQQSATGKEYVRPPHALSVRRVANDTALPGLEVDYEKHEISVLWRPMLSLLFGEEEYIKWAKKVDFQHSAVKESRQTMMDMVIAGEMDYEDYEDLLLDFVIRRDRRVLDAVRCARLRRYGRGDGGEKRREDTLKSNAVGRMRKDKRFQIFADEWEFQGAEECEGNFYDGKGMDFLGKHETNRAGEFEFVP